MPTTQKNMAQEVKKRPLKQREYVNVIGLKVKRHIIEGKEYTFEKKIALKLIGKGLVKLATEKKAK